MPGFWDDIFSRLDSDTSTALLGAAAQTSGFVPDTPYEVAPPALPVIQYGGTQPRLAMPTQETHTPQRFLDQSIGAEPTATQQGGLEGVIAGTMREDPIAIAGYSPRAIDWQGQISNRNYIGEYYMPQLPGTRFANVSDSIRFRHGTVSRPELGMFGDPLFADAGRHEFRHRGFEHLQRLAQVYGIPFDPAVARLPYNESERVNVSEDRRLGNTELYGGRPDFNFTNQPIERGIPQLTPATMAYLRGVADRILSARTTWQQSNPGRNVWDYENYGSPHVLR